MIGSCEIALHGCCLFNVFVSVEFSSIIEGYSLEHSAMFLDRLDTDGGNLFSGSGGYFLDDNEAGFAFDKGHNAVMAVSSDNSIALPMTNLRPIIDVCRTFRNVALTGKTASGVICIIPFSPLFRGIT